MFSEQSSIESADSMAVQRRYRAPAARPVRDGSHAYILQRASMEWLKSYCESAKVVEERAMAERPGAREMGEWEVQLRPQA